MSELYENIYNIVRRIPRGSVATYGQIAKIIGNPRLSRVIGYALNKCTDESIPAHRVVNREGRLAPGYDAQAFLLELEGITVINNRIMNLENYLWK